MNNLAFLMQKQGKLDEAWPGSLGAEITFLAEVFWSGQDKRLVIFLLPTFTGAIQECELMPRHMWNHVTSCGHVLANWNDFLNLI